MPPVSIHLVFPLCAMFLLTLFVLIKMFRTRVKAVKNGEIKVGYFKTYIGLDAPDRVLTTSRHFSNLFEAPVLFYLACVLGMILPVGGHLFLILAWLYVAARVIHAYVHMGNNKLKYRMPAYGFGWLVLTIMWVLIFVKALHYSTGN